MDDWKQLLRESIHTPQHMNSSWPEVEVSPHLERVIKEFPMRINKYYAGLIERPGDPIWLQSVADERELDDPLGLDDPLNEEGDSPVKHLTHRYPDRVLFLVTNFCAMYCRFCTRKRKVGRDHSITPATIQAGIDYIASHPEIRDVLVSGGDPLFLKDEIIDSILKRLREIPHVQVLRIGTRIPVVLPQRITPELVEILRRYHPLYVNTHFNHPSECTPEAAEACARMADAGIPLGNQAVLLKGVNDDPAVQKELYHKLLMMRVRPYYLYQADMITGTEHFRTPIQIGIDIIRSLRGHTTGFAVPAYVVDAPGGGGKIPVNPEYVVGRDGDDVLLRNFEGHVYRYPDPEGARLARGEVAREGAPLEGPRLVTVTAGGNGNGNGQHAHEPDEAVVAAGPPLAIQQDPIEGCGC